MRIRFDSTPFPLVRLDETVEVLDHRRKPINSSERKKRPGPYPYYGANGQVGTIDDYLFDDELVLVAEDGGFFFDPQRPISYRVSGKCWVNNHAHVLKAKNSTDPDWICYALSYVDVSDLIKGATRAKLNQKELRQIWIPLPPLDEQRRIVSRIKECLSRVEEMQKLRDQTLREAAKIEAAVFIDFLGTMADSVTPVPLGEVIKKAQYGISKKLNDDASGIPILRMGNLVDGHLDLTGIKYASLSPKELQRYRLHEGDLLINRTNSLELVGKSAVFTEAIGDYAFASYLIRLTVDESKAIPGFVNAVINSRLGRTYITATARRAIGMVNINAKEIARLPVPLPPIDAQRKVVAQLEQARRVGQSLITNMPAHELKSLQGSVLQRAFAGEL